MNNIGNIVIEDAKIIIRNFSGKEGKFNPAGRRNFCVCLDSSIEKAVEADGWNVRRLTPRDVEDAPQAYIQVAVSYDNIPPKIVLITSHGKTILDEESVSLLDWAEFKKVDIIIRPYSWDVNGKSGVKAYVKSLYITIYEDDFEGKYSDVPDSALSSMDHSDAD